MLDLTASRHFLATQPRMMALLRVLIGIGMCNYSPSCFVYKVKTLVSWNVGYKLRMYFVTPLILECRPLVENLGCLYDLEN